MRENQLATENNYYESQILTLNEKIIECEKIINKLEKQNDNLSIQSNAVNKSYYSNDNNNQLNEKIKNKLREKENYCQNLENEIEVRLSI